MAITRNYFKNTTTEPGTVSPWYDLSETQGTATTVSHSAGNTDVDTLVMSFRKAIATAIIADQIDLSISVAELTADTAYSFDVVHMDSAQNVISTTPRSAEITVAGVSTTSVSFTNETWSAGDIVEVRVWHRRTAGHGGNTFTVDVNHASSYMDADFAAMVYQGSSTQSGAGTLTASGIAISSSSAALSASASQVADGYFFSVLYGQTAQSSTATFLANGAREVSGVAAISVDSQFLSSGIALSYGTAALLPTASVTAQSYATSYASSTLASSAGFTQDGFRTTYGSSLFDSYADILASTTSPPVSGWSSSVIAFTEYIPQEFFGTTLADATASTTSSATVGRFGSSSVSATATTTSDSSVEILGDTSMPSDASVLATATIGMVSSTQAAAIATATFTGLIDVPGTASLLTDSTIITVGRAVSSSTTLMESTATSIVSAIMEALGASAMQADATVSIETASIIEASASITSTSSTSVQGILDGHEVLSITSSASVTVSGDRVVLGASSASATAALNSTASVEHFVSEQLSADAQWASIGVLDAPGYSSIHSDSTVLATGFVNVQASATLASTSSITVQGFVEKHGAAAFEATADSVYTGHLDAPGVVAVSGASTTSATAVVEHVISKQLDADAQVVSTATATLFGGGLSDAYASLAANGFVHITVATVQNLHLVNQEFGLVEIAWDALTYVDYYHIERDGSIIDQSLTNSYDDTNVSPDSTYTYRVRGVRTVV